MTFGKKQILSRQYPKTNIQFDNVIRAVFFGLDQSDLSVTKIVFFGENTCDNIRRMIEHWQPLFYLSSNFFFGNIMRWQKTSGLANQSSPTLTTPKCIKYQKISYIYLFCICTRRFESHGATDSLAICSSGK